MEYKATGAYANSSQYNPTLPDTCWWQESLKETAYAAAYAALDALRSTQSSRITAGLMYDATYEQVNMFTTGSTAQVSIAGWGFGGWGMRGEINLLTYNALQIAVDTLCSKLSQADVQIRYQTDGGNWADRKKAEQIEKLVKGEFYRLKFYEVADQARVDMLLHGRGYIKFYVDHETKRPAIERVHPLDVFYDELEARDCPPRQMYQVRLVAKSLLKALYPDFAQEINDANISGDSQTWTTRGLNPTDCLEVLECWYLPSYPGAGDGKHMMCIPTACLSGDGTPEAWDRMEFPFATTTWCKRRRGPYAIGLAEQVIFQQRDLNRLIQRMHECIYALSAPHILAEETANINPADFQSDGVGNIITYHMTEPKVVVNQVVPRDLIEQSQQLRRDIFDIAGITGLESTGNKPSGLDSEPALQEYTEQSSLRHIKTLKENERFEIRGGDMLLDTVRDIADQYGDYAAFGHFKDSVQEISWSEIELPPDKYVTRAAAANLLPDTPAGRKQSVIELSTAGILTPKQAVRALQSPDISAITDDVTSSEQDLEWTVYEMSKDQPRYLPPEPHQDLMEGIKRVRNAYLHERRANAPEKVLAYLDRWISEAEALLQQQRVALMQEQMQQQNMMMQQQAQMAQQQQLQQAQMGPQGAPQAAPVPA